MSSHSLIKPVRVYVGDGCALPPRMAVNRYNVIWSIVFIRDDGWTLAADDEHAQEAFNIWKGRWVQFQRVGEETQDISNYRKEHQ
jgi:hypothetical protein